MFLLRSLWIWLGIFGFAWTGIGCSQRQEGREGAQSTASPSGKLSKDELGKVVAEVGDTKITVGMVNDELNRQSPYIRMRFSSPERKKAFLKNWIQFEVLAQEAERRNLNHDPEVIREVKRVMVNKLVEELKRSLVKLDDISDAEVQAYYNKHKDKFNRPARVRASQIVTRTKNEAQKVLAMVKQKPSDVEHFIGLVEKYSIDEKSKNQRGDIGFFTRDDASIPKAVSEAAFAIPVLWQVAGPVKTKEGWVVLMKTGKEEGLNRSFDSEKNHIKNEVFNEKRQKAIEDFIDKLKAKAHIQIFEKNLKDIKPNLDPTPIPTAPGGKNGKRP